MVTLTSGELQATFDPQKGMNLTSYHRGDTEVIDQSTRNLFEERNAGLGALIGPHFHHKQEPDPYSHGLARYAAWKCEATDDSLTAVVTGDDLLDSRPLKELEGQNFTMRLSACLTDALEMELSVVSDTNSVVGFHTYYAAPHGSTVTCGDVSYTVATPIDQGNAPNEPLHGQITLQTPTHGLQLDYWCENEWNSWQLWHPEGASFVCIEPLSAKDPRNPLLSVSGLRVRLEIL